MIFGPALGYFMQYRDIKKSGSADGFSIWVCFILLTANIIRIIVKFGDPNLSNVVFTASIVIIIVQLILLELCVRTKQENTKPAKRNGNIYYSSWGQFWEWEDYRSYIEFILSFSIFFVGLYLIFDNHKLFITMLGLLSSCIEGCLGLPQLVTNMKKRSTEGFSGFLFMMWILGDVGKLLYFILKTQPFYLVLCVCCTLTVDFFILGQMLYYRDKTALPRYKFDKL